MKWIAFLTIALTLTCMSCTSSSTNSSSSASKNTCACICGTPEADFSGCPNEYCIKGERNPNNPDCVCGPMKIGGK